jgi:hypothetical protein
MTLNGYCFTATGITEYAFFQGDRNTLRVIHESLPNAPVRICTASGPEFAFSAPYSWEESPFGRKKPVPGTSYPFLDPDGVEAGRLYLLGADHFAVAVPGAALSGRIIHERLHRSVYYTALDDEPVASIEHDLERILTREQFGEWFPRRYVAEVAMQPEETLLALALSVPFLGFDALEVR